MLRMLKYDFYKIFKSKVLIALFVVPLCLTILNPIIWIINSNFSGSFLDTLHGSDLLFGLLWIFVVPFVAKDLSSKYIKNTFSTYSFADKIYYILSKVIFIFAYCLIFYIVYFLVLLIFKLFSCIAEGQEFIFANDVSGRRSPAEIIYYYLCSMISNFALGTLLMFFCTVLKKEYIVLIIVLPYLFLLSNLIYGTIDNALGVLIGVERYSVFGMSIAVINARGIWELTKCLLVSLGYSVLFTVLSWLSFFKRSF